jgi:hypothetical protein
MFIIGVIATNCVLGKTLMLINSVLHENNLNCSPFKGSFLSSSFLAYVNGLPLAHSFGTCGHPSFISQLNVPKTFLVTFGVFN